MLTFSTTMLLTHILSEVVASETPFAVAGVQAHLAVVRTRHTGMLHVVVTWRTVVSAFPMVQEMFHPSSVCVQINGKKLSATEGIWGIRRSFMKFHCCNRDTDW